MDSPQPTTPAQVAASYGVGKLTRHIFLCLGPDCCDPAQGQESWDYLKKRMKELGLVAPAGACYRTKAACFRICQDGPIAVVYPDGTWYKNATPANIDRILVEHLMAGKPVEELCFATNPLPNP